MTSRLGSINLPVGLAELRETFYVLDDQFFIKGPNSGPTGWKRSTGRGLGKGTQDVAPLLPDLHVFSSLETT